MSSVLFVLIADALFLDGRSMSRLDLGVLGHSSSRLPFSSSQNDNGCPPAATRCIRLVHAHHQRMFLQNGVDSLPEDALPFAVDDPDFAKALCVGRFEIVIEQFFHLPRLERMQIEGVLDREHNGFL